MGGFTRILLLSCLFLQQTRARMTEKEEHDFIIDYMIKIKGLDPEQQSLLVYNFGYDRPLPFPSIALTPDSTLRLNLQTSGMGTPSRRSIAVVGQKYLGKFQEILRVVERIHEDTQALPSDIFLQSKNEIELENMVSSHPMHETPSLVNIPKKRSSTSFVTTMKCEVTSSTTHGLLISKEISYKSYKEICSGEPKKVNLGYNNVENTMKVTNNTLMPYPKLLKFLLGEMPALSYGWEIFFKFFSIYNIEPNWLDCGYTWGWYNESLGGWTGCMGKIERDEADVAANGDYVCYDARAKIAACAPGFYYMPEYWFSRYPDKVKPIWNLLKLFDPISWSLIFLSLIFVKTLLFISARIGTSNFGIRTYNEEIILSPFRVPLIENQAARLNFGFASNMTLGLWCVCGGLLLHMLESNYLGILVKTNYKKPVDSGQDILDRGLTIIQYPGTGAKVEISKNSPFPLIKGLAEMTVVAEGWDDYDKMGENAIETGSSVILSAFLMWELDWATNLNTSWYRSKDRDGANPITSFMTNKKWTLEEEFNNHLLRFQQAGLTLIEAHFEVEKEKDEPEPLILEHFYFPLGLWLGGLLLSAIFLLAEIIIHRRRKTQTEVGMLRLEDPSITQSTPESENLGENVLNKCNAVPLRLSDKEGEKIA